MKKQPDSGMDAVHTRLAVAMKDWREKETPVRAAAVGLALSECADPECLECGQIMCPHGEPMHYHHDGCPACDGGDHG